MKVRFHGHACFSLIQGGSHLLMDPFEPAGLSGAVALNRPDVTPTHVVCTHQHGDHAAVAQFPTAAVVTPGYRNADFQIDGMAVDHDMHDGHLRGGQTTVLRIQTSTACLVHLGDMGERLRDEHLEWLLRVPLDLLIVPAGGWFTLDAGGVLEAIRLLRPAAVWACHTLEDGVKLRELETRDTLLRLWRGPTPEYVSEYTAYRTPTPGEIRLLLSRATP